MDQERGATPVKSTATSAIVIHLSRPAFALSWFIILLLHAACAVYYYYVVQLHQFLKVHYFLNYLGPTYFQYIDAVIIASYVLVGVNALAILVPVLISIWHRELTFDMSFQSKNNRTTNTMVSRYTSSIVSRLPSVNLRSKLPSSRAIKMIERTFIAWFGPQGYLSIEHPYFNEILVVREIVENACQFFQAYQLSSLISSVWINRVYAIALVFNCWSSLVVNTLCSWRERRRTSPESHPMANESIRRLGYLVFDMLLNGFSSIVIPLVVIHKYVHDYDPGSSDFPFLYYYNDTWFIKAAAENSQLFVRNGIDFVSKVLPAVAFFTTLFTLRSAIRRHKVVSSVKNAAISQDGSSKKLTPIQDHTNAPMVHEHPQHGSSKKLTEGTTNTPMIPGLHQHRFRKLHRISHTFLFVWGLIIILLHVYVTSLAVFYRIPGCLLEIRPWFSNQYNCVVIELNCDRILRTHPNATNVVDMNPVLATLAASTVRKVIISSCPQLVMPTRITTFNRLFALKFYNSTIVEWGADAALQGAKHPDIQFLSMIETNMSALPEGLLSPDFPHTIQDIEISGTNLSSLPTNLHEIWGLTNEELNQINYVDYFIFENVYGGFNDVPFIFADPNGLQTRILSLCDTGLSYIPDHFLWANSPMIGLQFGMNPLVTLPDLEPGSPMITIGLWFCENLEELPAWAYDPTNTVTFLLGGTSFCPSVDDPMTSSLSSDAGSMWNVVCSLPPNATTMYYYPRDYERYQREISYTSEV